MRVVMYGNGSGSQYWRLVDPAILLRKRGIDVVFPIGGITPEALQGANIIVLQGCVDKNGIALSYMFQEERGLYIVVDQDDDIVIDKDNPHFVEHEYYDAQTVVSRTISIADAVTTTTPYLANKLKQLNPNVFVLPNYMRKARWDLGKNYGKNDKIRIGWVGSTTHMKDLESIMSVLENVYNRYRNEIEFIFVGDPRIRSLVKFPAEVSLGVPFDFYPSKLFGLNLDIGLVPLLDNDFNRSKSGIKVMEMGICGVPVVASRVVPYLEFEGYINLASSPDEFGKHLVGLIENESKRKQQGKLLKDFVKKNYMLDNHIDKWVALFENLVDNKIVNRGENLQTP